MTRRQILSFYRRRYTPASIVVAAAGNLDHATVVRQVRRPSAAAGRVVPARRLPCRAPASRRRGARRPVAVHAQRHRAGPRRGRWAGHRPASTSAGSRSACSTTCSAAACRAGCSRRSASAAAWRTRSTRTPPSSRTAACSGSTPDARPARSRRCSTSTRTELAEVAADGVTDDELARGKGMAQGGVRARAGGHRFADEPARQGRAALRRPAHRRRAARPGRRRDRSTRSTRWPRNCSPSPCRSRSWGRSARTNSVTVGIGCAA